MHVFPTVVHFELLNACFVFHCYFSASIDSPDINILHFVLIHNLYIGISVRRLVASWLIKLDRIYGEFRCTFKRFRRRMEIGSKKKVFIFRRQILMRFEIVSTEKFYRKRITYNSYMFAKRSNF